MEISESITELPGEADNHQVSEDTQRLMLREGEGRRPQHWKAEQREQQNNQRITFNHRRAVRTIPSVGTGLRTLHLKRKLQREWGLISRSKQYSWGPKPGQIHERSGMAWASRPSPETGIGGPYYVYMST